MVCKPLSCFIVLKKNFFFTLVIFSDSSFISFSTVAILLHYVKSPSKCLSDSKHIDDIVFIPLYTYYKRNTISTNNDVFVSYEIMNVVLAKFFPISRLFYILLKEFMLSKTLQIIATESSSEFLLCSVWELTNILFHNLKNHFSLGILSFAIQGKFYGTLKVFTR